MSATLTTPTGLLVPSAWYRDAKEWLREFWAAQTDYEYVKTRSCTAAKVCNDRMWAAIAHLERLGVIWDGLSMPSLDRFELGCGERVRAAYDTGCYHWRPREGRPLPWIAPANRPEK